MATNLLDDVPKDIDRHELRQFLDYRVGGPGQYDSTVTNKLYLPQGGSSCQLILIYDGAEIVGLQQGYAFDATVWRALVQEMTSLLLSGPMKIGREFSFSSYRVEGSWQGERSGVQILPAPVDAPRAPFEMAQHPFVLEFPIRATDVWRITDSRRIREHRKYTLLLNVLLSGRTNLLSNQPEHFWASVPQPRQRWTVNWVRRLFGLKQKVVVPWEILWVQEFFFGNLGTIVRDDLSEPPEIAIHEMPAEAYYGQVGHDGLPLRVPSDLDASLCAYQSLPRENRDKFDRALFWMDLASRYWNASVSSSFAALVSAVEALTTRGTMHRAVCSDCGPITHEVPGATERFRQFFEQYASGQSLRKRRTEMYDLRSGILHGSKLMAWDVGRAMGWDPPFANEYQMHQELWNLTQLAIRNWLKGPPSLEGDLSGQSKGAEDPPMNDPETYRARYRFRLQKKLSISEKERRLNVAGREVVVSSQMPDTKIENDEWLVMNARGFASEEEATDFARRLKAASEFSSVIARLGINAGVDKPTSGFGKAIRDAAFEKEGISLRDNVHGVDVFLDQPNVRIGHFSAVGTVRSAADPFLSEIDELYMVVDGASQRAKDIVLLLNYALTRTDPVAMILFAFSAVEMLGQDETWSDPQKRLLADLAVAAEQSAVGTENERAEVVIAVRRGTQKISLRQGVLRMLNSLDLSHLRVRWDELYGERSTLVHGLAPNPGADYGELAHNAMSLCGHILITAIASEVAGASKYLDKYYPVS